MVREKNFELNARDDALEALGDELNAQYGGRARCGRAQGAKLCFEVQSLGAQVEALDWSTLKTL